MSPAIDKSISYRITFKEFQNLVNKSISSKCGLGLADMPDFDLWSYYDNEMSLNSSEWKQLASEAANDLLDEEGFNDF
jgi:hypothetical protein